MKWRQPGLDQIRPAPRTALVTLYLAERRILKMSTLADQRTLGIPLVGLKACFSHSLLKDHVRNLSMIFTCFRVFFQPGMVTKNFWFSSIQNSIPRMRFARKPRQNVRISHHFQKYFD